MGTLTHLRTNAKNPRSLRFCVLSVHVFHANVHSVYISMFALASAVLVGLYVRVYVLVTDERCVC